MDKDFNIDQQWKSPISTFLLEFLSIEIFFFFFFLSIEFIVTGYR